MPKHVALGLSLRSFLRSKKFISYLNRLEHCVSYDTISRIETRWAETILSKNNDFFTMPSNIQQTIFTQAASDNSDYLQEEQ